MASKRREFLKNTGLGILSASTLSGAVKKTSTWLSKTSSNIECDKTTLDFYGAGPFYTEQPPEIVDHQLASPTQEGERIIISGRVFNLDCSEFIPNAIIDVWHADHNGQYDNQDYNLRGFTRSNDQGFYLFETIHPGKYLNGSDYRPAHIHFKIKPPGFPLLTTQMYFEGDDKIASDAAASITSGSFDATHRIIKLEENDDGMMEGNFDIVVSGEGITVGTNDVHIHKGMIYTVAPNPFDSQVEIKYGVFKKAMVGIYVFDVDGREVAVLEEKMMQPDKYTVFWNPKENLPSGHYFVSIQINRQQVHYLKIVRN